MNEHESKTGDPNERLDPKIHRDLAQLGWKIPQSEAEVRAAEEWASKLPGEIPARLRGMPNKDRSQKPGGLLGRYLRDDGGIARPMRRRRRTKVGRIGALTDDD